MSDLVDLTSRLLDDGYVICTEKTGEQFTVLLRRTRAEGTACSAGPGTTSRTPWSTRPRRPPFPPPDQDGAEAAGPGVTIPYSWIFR